MMLLVQFFNLFCHKTLENTEILLDFFDGLLKECIQYSNNAENIG